MLQVPALQADELKLFESGAIVLHIADHLASIARHAP
jgi:glutathione S-transferase